MSKWSLRFSGSFEGHDGDGGDFGLLRFGGGGSEDWYWCRDYGSEFVS